MTPGLAERMKPIMCLSYPKPLKNASQYPKFARQDWTNVVVVPASWHAQKRLDYHSI
jgi:hypothetical protein